MSSKSVRDVDLSYLPKCTECFHRLQKIRTCFKCQAKQVLIQRGLNWRILVKRENCLYNRTIIKVCTKERLLDSLNLLDQSVNKGCPRINATPLRRQTVHSPLFSVRSSKPSTLRYGRPSWMSVKSTQGKGRSRRPLPRVPMKPRWPPVPVSARS